MNKKKTAVPSFLITGLCLSLIAGSPTVSCAAEENKAVQESIVTPESCTVSVSAQALSDTEVSVLATVSCSGEGSQIDLLSIILPGSYEQILSSSDSVFSFTAGSDLEGCEVSYIPGSSVTGEDIWFNSLAGSFTIPVIHTGSDEDTGSSADPDTASSEADSSDSSEASSTEAGTSDTSADSSSEAGTSGTSADSSSEADTSTASSSSTSGSSSGSKSKSTKKSRKSSGSTSSGSSGTGSSSGSSSAGSGASSNRSHSGSSGRSNSSGSSSHSRSTSSKTSDKTKSQNQKEETSSDDTQLITEATSALGKRLLKNGETLTDDEENAPKLDGMTYEATWENEDAGVCLYLYEEGYAVLEVSSSRSGKPASAGSSSKTETSAETGSSLRFLLLPEQTEESSLNSILDFWRQ